jgi:D-alanyl-lipoteichoic acid acyltransferase DltB (MBOAT superfamily)
MARASRSLQSYLLLLAQLAGLLLLFRLYRLEQDNFLLLGGLVFGAFAVHYWLPFHLKEPAWIAVSMAGAFLLLDPRVAGALLGLGLLFYGICVLPLPYFLRAGLVVATFVALMLARTHSNLAAAQFWPVFGAIFMFRMVVYLYDLRHMKKRPSLQEYLSYFFILPNYYFLLFPVIDFQTMRKSYYRRDIHQVAQQGIQWMLRGAAQLLVYRLIYHYKPPSTPDNITSFWSLVQAMAATYLLYLRVSGTFHIIIGMLHLFGYDLPETHRKYLMARSLTDFWRRINIYWKDFMVKTVFFPVFFRLRKSGELRAQIIATSLVFLVTWLTHAYQVFWIAGEFLFTWPDTLFWGILGLFVIANLILEQRRKRPSLSDRKRFGPQLLQVSGTLMLITFLWFLWNTPSLRLWLDLLTWWRIG